MPATPNYRAARRRLPGPAAAPLSRRAVLSVAAAAGLLAACETPDPGLSLPDLDFSDWEPIRLDVARVDVFDEYRMPFLAPNIEHLSPVAPGGAAERWAADVLKPAGAARSAAFVVARGGMIEEELPAKAGLAGLFTIDHTRRYTAELDARLDILDGSRRLATARAFASASQTAPEDLSPNGRSNLWYGLVERVVEVFDAEMRARAAAHLGAYLA